MTNDPNFRPFTAPNHAAGKQRKKNRRILNGGVREGQDTRSNQINH